MIMLLEQWFHLPVQNKKFSEALITSLHSESTKEWPEYLENFKGDKKVIVWKDNYNNEMIYGLLNSISFYNDDNIDCDNNDDI